MEVKVDAAVLDRVARHLATVGTELPGMLAEARALDASLAVVRLTEIPAWAQDTSVDLHARVGLVRLIENQAISGLAGGVDWVEVLGAEASLPLSLAVLDGTMQSDATTQWARRPGESLDDWIVRIKGEVIDRLPLLDGKGQVIAEGLDWFGGYLDMLVAGGYGTAAVATLGKTQLARSVVMPHLDAWLRAGQISETTYAKVRNTYALYKAPGTTMQSLLMRVVPFEQLNRVPAGLTRWAASAGLRQALPYVEGALPTAGRNGVRFLFGSPWTDQRLTGPLAELPRGGSNLVTVARTAAPGTRLSTVASTAGFLRGAGAVGGVVSTGYDVANLVSQGNPVEAFKKDKAGYVADVSRTAFNGSLTAAVIAPSPVTWGAVAVTGVVYGGAELVDHWDDVTHATSEAAGWMGDRVDDVGGSISDGAKAVADSKVNPMNWF